MQNENGSRGLKHIVSGWIFILLAAMIACGAANGPRETTSNNSPPKTDEGEHSAAAKPNAQTSAKKVNSKSVKTTHATAQSAVSNNSEESSFTKVNAAENDELSETKIVRFEWCPNARAATSYQLSEIEDQHRIVLPKGIRKGVSYPVVIAFHGQPKRGKDPREYSFMDPVQQQVLSMIEQNRIQPVILVLPVFRFEGSNWPWFQPKLFQQKVMELLAEEGFQAADWYAFGHSGAAGCGGGGLNQIHLISPRGVGFFDTCLGEGWQKEIKELQRMKVETFNIHSVETAGFKPKQYPEYQSGFDFGRAYSPLGIEPIECPAVHPGEQLRSLLYRCSATKDGTIKSFVVDTGDGAVAHKRLVAPAVEYFLTYFFKK